MPDLAFDYLLAAMLILLAWRVMTDEDLFKATVLFIVFGVLLALTWVRLEAPDIALIEAAVAAGFMGALMLEAVAHYLRSESQPGPHDDEGPP